MDRRFNSFFAGGEQEEVPSTPENSIGSPFPGEKKSRSAASPKRRKRAVQKRVVSVPIVDMEGSRMKGEGAPPSDSWAWRKYGQKPIKGSPYPRGYYRCSSSKGCPARKQVERSQVDPTMIVVTYACEHNHQAGPTPRTAAAHAPKPPLVFSTPPETEPDGKFADLPDEAPLSDDFGWFSNVASSSSPSTEAVFHSPIFTGSHVDDADVAEMIFPMREEDESLFADLGELPEFSMVFRHGVLEQEENLRAAPWCRSTS